MSIFILGSIYGTSDMATILCDHTMVTQQIVSYYYKSLLKSYCVYIDPVQMYTFDTLQQPITGKTE